MQNLLIDTNVLQYGVKAEYAEQIATLISQLATEDYTPTTSAFTTFEIYRGLAHNRITAVKHVLDRFSSPFEVDLTVLKIAAALTTCYRTNEATKSYVDRYNEGDAIIAATAIRFGAHLLTANGNDFPRPFFCEYKNVAIKNSSRPINITLQVLVPDVQCFNQAVKECYR